MLNLGFNYGEKHLKSSWQKEFSNPSSAYRAKPFWAWNGKLEEKELRRQVHLLGQMGFGGFFMHSRTGLATPYLSKEWFKLAGACADEAGKRGMEAWLYDEDRWPSGAAGGLVTKNPQFQMKYLEMTVQSSGNEALPAKVRDIFVKPSDLSAEAIRAKGEAKGFLAKEGDLHRDKNLIAVFAAKLNSGKISEVERIYPEANLKSRNLNVAQQVGRGVPAEPVLQTAHPEGSPYRLGTDKSGKKILVFRIKSQSPSDWYNGYTYLDVLNPEAVKEFIRVTHAGYKKHVGVHFGKRIPGIFTDEPNYFHGCGPKSHVLPWTGALPVLFNRRYGYDLVNHLPELFFLPEGVEFSRVRYHFVDCITWMFTDAFARQIGEWCGRNKLLFTGHVNCEDALSLQTGSVGSAMRFYEHMQAPGMDLLTERWRIYDTAKQVSSVARQFGRKWRLSETDGCTGWDFSFAGHKALGDWQAALGINVRCPHLAWYTMEGQAKRDYPASIFYQSPWWKDYRIVEDYFARIHAVMTRGGEVRDLLVIHPIESLWGTCRIGEADWSKAPATIQYDRQLQTIRDALLSNHIDFDYGDEDIMSRHGRVRENSGPRFIIGKAEYKAVLVPPLVTIRSATLALLRRFRVAGGLVVFLGKPPEYVDALPSQEAVEFSRQCRYGNFGEVGTDSLVRPSEWQKHGGTGCPALPGKSWPDSTARGNQMSDFIQVLEGKCRRISVTDGRGKEIPSVLYLLRSDRESYYLFLCNTGHSRKQLNLPQKSDVAVTERKTAIDLAFIRGFGECLGKPIELAPSSGEMGTTNAERKNGLWEIKTSFPALGSRLFIIPKEKRKKTYDVLSSRPTYKTIKRVWLAKNWWSVVLSENNCLVLDRPRFKIGKSAWQGAEEILRVDGKVRDSLGWKHRGGQMIQPWAQKNQADSKQKTIELKYEFNVETLPTGDVFLAVERPDLYVIAINGIPIETDMDCGWWVDQSLRKVPLPVGALKTGRNEISLACKYTSQHPGFEIIYLLGAFGVRLKNRIGYLTEMPRFLQLGDWCRQGLPFYSGSVGYTCGIRAAVQTGQRIVLHVPDYSGVAVKVWVDGKDAGYAAWPPWQVDITRMLDGKKHQHELRFEVLGHRRNSHGPLHRAGKLFYTSPGEFISKGKLWSDDYQLVSCGLQKPPELLTLLSVGDMYKI